MQSSSQSKWSLRSVSCAVVFLPSLTFAQFKIEPFDRAQPSAIEQSEMVERVRLKAIEYSKSLPNFICTQLTRRYSAKPPKQGKQPDWKLSDSLTIKLTYFDQQEKYTLITLNGKPSAKTMDQLSGGKWRGDFGSTLRSVFDPKSMTFFSWAQWGKVDGRIVAILDYGIDVSHAAFGTTFTRNGHRQHIGWGCEGKVVIDAQTLEVFRITVDSVDLPPSSPVGEVHLVLDYGRQRVGGEEFLLPTRSLNWTRNPGGQAQKGESTFTNYQKFGAESGIKFDAAR